MSSCQLRACNEMRKRYLIKRYNKATVLKSIKKNVKKHGIFKNPSGKHVRVIYTPLHPTFI